MSWRCWQSWEWKSNKLSKERISYMEILLSTSVKQPRSSHKKKDKWTQKEYTGEDVCWVNPDILWKKNVFFVFFVNVPMVFFTQFTCFSAMFRHMEGPIQTFWFNYIFMQFMGLFYNVNKNHVFQPSLNISSKIGVLVWVFIERMYCFGDCGICILYKCGTMVKELL